MEFLGVGYQELLVILVLMLVVVGPERLPGMAYQIGKAVRTLQGYARQVRDEFGDEISYLEDQYKTVKGEMDTARQSMRSETARLNSEFRDATEPLRTPIPLRGGSSDGAATPAEPATAGAPEASLAASEPAPPAPETPKPAPLVF